MRLFDLKGSGRSREPTDKPVEASRFQMVTTWGEYYYSWNGKLYESDIVRACIRPKVKAIGKLVGKHIVDSGDGIRVNPRANIRFLLQEPNPMMSGQIFLEKMATQLCLNNNAFALIVRDEYGLPCQLYPIPAVMAEAVYGQDGELYLKFTYKNGKTGSFFYSDIIHLRQDYYDNDVFGANPAPALSQLMECVGIIDQGIVKAIKNSGIIRWLLKFTQSMRPEDIKNNVKSFVDNYLSYESDTFGAAGVDAKAEAKQIEPKDYVPNAAQTDRITDRLYSFFNTNKKIVQSNWNEDEWNAYYEAEVEPIALQMGAEMTRKLFSRREISVGNSIVFEASNLTCASMQTKLSLQAMVDRAAMTINEWRRVMNMAPVEGGDVLLRRLDTEVMNSVQECLKKMNADNYVVIGGIIEKILDCQMAHKWDGGDMTWRDTKLISGE